jgi:hypothetical protein
MATMKKSATPPRPAGDKVKISPSVKVILKQVGQLNAGAKQVLMQNIRATNKPTASETKAVSKALKAANKPTNKTGSEINRLERKQYNKMSAAEQKKMLTVAQNVERARPGTFSRNTTKGSKMKPVPSRGSGRLRIGGGGGALRFDDMNR